MGIAAIVLQFLPYLIKGAAAAPELWDFIQKIRGHLNQTNQWTPEQRAEFDAKVEAVTSQEHWKPETPQP